MNIYLTLIIFLFSFNTYAKDDECSYFKFCGNTSPPIKKASSAATKSIINPSNLAKIKGLGVETLYMPHNPLAFSIVTGNGKIGGALVSPSLENSFFGNRSLELDIDYFNRFNDEQRYRTKKVNLAAGISLVNKPNFSLELGLSARRNPDIKKINYGAGVNAKIWKFSLGAYLYHDDVKLDLRGKYRAYSGELYSVIHNSEDYQERYDVKTLTFGTQIWNLQLDVGYINTRYDFYNRDTNILIYTAALNLKKVLLNYGYREERSPNLYYANREMYEKQYKNFQYYGLQFIPTKRVMIGVGYNTFLLRDISTTLTLFLN